MLESSIQELDLAFRERNDDVSFVKRLLHELNHRSTKRARTLKALATRAYQARTATSEEWESKEELALPRVLKAPANNRDSEDRSGGLSAALSWPIEILRLPTRAFNLLSRFGVRYLGEAVSLSPADLLSERGAARCLCGRLRKS